MCEHRRRGFIVPDPDKLLFYSRDDFHQIRPVGEEEEPLKIVINTEPIDLERFEKLLKEMFGG